MKYIYFLEHFASDQPVVVGAFTSLLKAKDFLKTLTKKFPYAIYKIPTNTNLTKGRRLEDQQGIFEHWHYGTNKIEYVNVSENGVVIDSGTTIEVTWPE